MAMPQAFEMPASTLVARVVGMYNTFLSEPRGEPHEPLDKPRNAWQTKQQYDRDPPNTYRHTP